MRTDVTLRLATEADAVAVAAIYAPIVRDTAISFETAEVPPSEMARRIVTTLSHHPWLVAEVDRDVLGYAYATQHRARAAYDWSVDVSVYIATDGQRRGLGRALYTALLDLLATQGYVNAFAGIALPNAASVALHESMGFTAVGVYRSVGWKLGSWHDVGWWQRRLTTTDEPPCPRVALPDLSASQVAAALDAGVRTVARSG